MTTIPVSQSGEKPTGLSPSRTSQFNQCARKYKYISVERLPEPKSKDAYRGTILHAVLETLFAFAKTPDDRTYENAVLIFRALYPTMMDEAHTTELGMTDAQRQVFAREIVDLVRGYFSMEDPVAVNLVATEQNLSIDMGGWTCRGIIDRLDRRSDGGLDIVDYKSGKQPRKQWEEDAFKAMKVYAYLIQQTTGEIPKRLRLYYVKTGQILNREVTPATLTWAEEWVRSTWAKVETAYDTWDFPPTFGPLCNWCSYRELCDAEENPAFS